ncbi:rabenosyn-5, partial [Phenoliferia sp. Uapishka_3]
MSFNGVGSPAYAPYASKGKRSSTASMQSIQSAQGTSSSQLGQPQPQPSHTSPSRPSWPSQWSNPNSPNSTPPPLSTSTSTPPASFPFQSVAPGNSPFPPSTPLRLNSPQQSTSTSTSRAITPNGQLPPPQRSTRMPYHATFQPAGVRRDRTQEFATTRRKKGEGKKLEQGRLCRRMDKDGGQLVNLHFSPPTEQTTTSSPRSSSSIAQLAELGGSLRGKSARDLWRSVAGGKSEAERVCFLPPTPPSDFLPPPSTSMSTSEPTPPARPTRRERCSTFFTYVYDGLAVKGEKDPVGLIVEVEQVEQDGSLSGVVADGNGSGNGQQTKERDERIKVRICRDCLNAVLRNQETHLPPRTPTWVKLYEVLVQLEKEIEITLPEFQELVLGLQKPSTVSSLPSASTALTLRKRLLTNLASYDTLSKRISSLPLSPGGIPGGSQDRLQRAIAARGQLFLGEKLALLRTLGDIEEPGKKEGKKKRKEKEGSKNFAEPTVQSLASLLGKEGGGVEVDEKSGKLAVLLEQESLVKGYVDDAIARRQFEDSASLKASLQDLREEIARVRATL